MKFKVIKVGTNNKVTFTKEELEELLDEVYESGRKDGYNALFYPYTAPPVPDMPEQVDPPTIEQIDWDSILTPADEEALKLKEM